MDIEKKRELLARMGTANLIKRLASLEHDLEEALAEELNLQQGRSSEVKQILAELATEIPAGIKNQAGRDAWLVKQRIENERLAKAISEEGSIVFLTENTKCKVEMARQKLESVRAILRLRTAQINFLSRD